ncbi:hypothetical protein, partial [Magnetovibrio blakemorei]|uniref:hypothetical protein n=1 Tax=Magnetovibrio blakemorei TaxID=28181 RepID=UPI003898FB9C
GCGFRIVTVFQTDILDVVQDLITLIKHEGGKSPFLKGRLKEAVIYTNRPVDEENSVHVLAKQLIDNANFVFEDNGYAPKIAEPENKKSGYSSIHLVAFVPVEVSRWNGEIETVHQTVEIQVRDIFEEAWGEVDHALRYMVQREQDGDIEDHPRVAQWRPHLNALKTFADGCSQHASLIKKNAIDAAAVIAGEEHLSVDSASDAISELQEILPATFHTELRQAFDCRDNASRALDNPTESRELFDEAADMFHKLIKRGKMHLDKKLESTRTVGYRLEMELAYCLRTEDASKRKQAITIYNDQLKAFPFDVTASYRLGMIFRIGGQMVEALKAFLDAGKNLDRDSTIKA